MSQKTSGLSKANLDPAEAKAACRKLAAQNRNHLAASQTDAAPCWQRMPSSWLIGLAKAFMLPISPSEVNYRRLIYWRGLPVWAVRPHCPSRQPKASLCAFIAGRLVIGLMMGLMAPNNRLQISRFAVLM
jgi:hypothetical protein